MSDSSKLDALARRYLDLWEEQTGAWASDAALADILRLWLELVGLDRYGAAVRSGMNAGGWSDRTAGASRNGGQDPAGTAAAAPASGDRDHDMAEFARRLATLEQRLAAVETRIPTADAGPGRGPARGRTKGVRSRP